jgi:hypothetical protein
VVAAIYQIEFPNGLYLLQQTNSKGNKNKAGKRSNNKKGSKKNNQRKNTKKANGQGLNVCDLSQRLYNTMEKHKEVWCPAFRYRTYNFC